MISLKQMFSGFKKQMRQALVPRARLHVRGQAAVVYRRWLGIDIRVSERTSARLLPSLLTDRNEGTALKQPRVSTLSRAARVVPRRGIGLNLVENFALSPLDLIKQGARSALLSGSADFTRSDGAQNPVDPSLPTHALKMGSIRDASERPVEGRAAILSDTAKLSAAEENYISSMRLKTSYGGTPEIYALSQLLGKAISVYERTGDGGLKKRLLFTPEHADGALTLRLSYMGTRGAHYDPIAQEVSGDALSPQEAEALAISSVAGDGQCLWNAVGKLVGQEPDALRAQTVDYMVEHARDRPAFLGGARTLLEDAVDSIDR